VKRNLSGKYRVTPVSTTLGTLDRLARSEAVGLNIEDGVYIGFDDVSVMVRLVSSDPDRRDYFVPNGGFNGRRHEMLSYLTDSRLYFDASPFLEPTTPRPGSETEGLKDLDVVGKSFSNIPPLPSTYVSRDSLESELSERLRDDRYPVVTLAGRGGIGKTSLALTVLKTIADEGRYGAILWFSSRDIDLLPEGPKQVRAHLRTEAELAAEFCHLTNPAKLTESGFDKINHLARALGKSPIDMPILFVFDNFETVKSPVELFNWINTYIRLPNKVLITTRSRDFNGDYHVHVGGMAEDECGRLIDSTAGTLGILPILTQEYRDDLYLEADGHPYVIKVLLGEVAKTSSLPAVKRIVADKEGMLDALFDRTFTALTPAAKLVFLLLCSWRSVVPQLAIEAVFIVRTTEKVDVDAAVDELVKSSFIESSSGKGSDEAFLSVPLVAAIFGKRKLDVSPLKPVVEGSRELLIEFGVGQRPDVRQGVGPRIGKLFAGIARRVNAGADIVQYEPMLEFLARRWPSAWNKLADLYEEIGDSTKAQAAFQKLAEFSNDVEEKRTAWEGLIGFYAKSNDVLSELHAIVELCVLDGSSARTVSNGLNRWNQIYKKLPLNSDERRALVSRLIALAERFQDEFDATDFSRAGWASLTINEEDRARAFVEKGIAIDPRNDHCIGLINKLQKRLI